jgi:hypothetical protein
MAANTNPIYGRTPDVQVGGAVLGPSQETAQNGTGTNLSSIFQADTTEGGWVDSVVLKPVGSPAATVARLFYHDTNGSFTPGTTNTVVNTALIDEISTVATTSSNTLAQNAYVFSVRRQLKPGNRLLIGFGTSTGASGTGYAVTTFGSKY